MGIARGSSSLPSPIEAIRQDHKMSDILCDGATFEGYKGVGGAGVAQWLERQLAMLKVAGSNPVARSILFCDRRLKSNEALTS